MHQTVASFEIPIREPCPFCELAAGRRETKHVINSTEKTITFVKPWQFEIRQPPMTTPNIMTAADKASKRFQR